MSNGLAGYRARQAEEKRLRMLELEHYRAYATTEVRDGREWSVVRIPDGYETSRDVEIPPPVVPRNRNRRLRRSEAA
jgi:hypothetical protein